MAMFELMPDFLMKENGTGLQLWKRCHPPEETLFPGHQAEEAVPRLSRSGLAWKAVTMNLMGLPPPALTQQVRRASEKLLTGSQVTLVTCRPHCEEQGAQASPLNPP